MLASVSKTITLTAIMQLWEEGRFALDDDINPHLQFPVYNPHYPDEVITFRQLLTHTSSIKDNWAVLSSVYSFGVDSPIDLETFMTEYFTPGGLYYSATQNFYSYEPGEAHHYCNQAVTLSGYLVEAIADQPFDDRSQERVLDPLGMNATNWHLEGLDLDQLAMPYGYDEATGFFPYGHFTYPDYPAGGLFSNIRELAVFLMMYMNSGIYHGIRILDEDTVDLIFSPQVPDINPNQGLIWFYLQHEGHTYIGHGGSDIGVHCFIAFRPSDQIGALVLSNASITSNIEWQAFYDIFYALFEHATYFRDQ
jgi:CubicO group peptidase (beta-lactamase class C family)